MTPPKPKDPNAPKRPLNAFFLFCGLYRAEVRKRLPKTGKGELARELGVMWARCGGEERQKFEKLAADAMAKWKEKLAVYKSFGNDASSN